MSLAINAGFNPKAGKLKINAVIKKDINDNQIFDLVDFAKKRSIEIRFIEYMDVGTSNNWKPSDVFFSERIISSLILDSIFSRSFGVNVFS